MMTNAKPWTLAAAWATAMMVIWVLFVPSHISHVWFALLALAGLFASLFGAALVGDSQAPRSVGAILADLEEGKSARSSRPKP